MSILKSLNSVLCKKHDEYIPRKGRIGCAIWCSIFFKKLVF